MRRGRKTKEERIERRGARWPGLLSNRAIAESCGRARRLSTSDCLQTRANDTASVAATRSRARGDLRRRKFFLCRRNQLCGLGRRSLADCHLFSNLFIARNPGRRPSQSFALIVPSTCARIVATLLRFFGRRGGHKKKKIKKKI